MNILLVGGSSRLMNCLIRKFRKEGHRVCLLTGNRFKDDSYERVFETYRFPYDSEAVKSVFESVLPDVTVFLGAYDSNFRWDGDQNTVSRFLSALMNLVVSFESAQKGGRFLYLSSEEVYGGDRPEDITEDMEAWPETVKGMALAQGENDCSYYGKLSGRDIVTLRLQHLYGIPQKKTQCNETLTWFCLEALRGNKLRADENRRFALLYESDAVEFIYGTAVCAYHEHNVYNLSSSQEVNEAELARKVCTAMYRGAGQQEEAEDRETEDAFTPEVYASAPGSRCVLSNERFMSEFNASLFGNTDENIERIVAGMKAHRMSFLTDRERRPTFSERIRQKAGWFLQAVAPFAENMICFFPFFLLNYYAAGNTYFSRLDVYLLYVLLFAVVHGQHQAIFSAVLATIGYFFQQSFFRDGFEVAMDYNTYVWIAQLFIVGLVVGYQRDRIRQLRSEVADEQEYLSNQLADIKGINESNVRVKGALTTQIINQSDSIGKIYRMTSELDMLMPEEVLFRAASMLGELMESRDVAVYTVSNREFARLFSATSVEARQGGNSIRYREWGELSEALENHKVYINRRMEEKYPMMAGGIYDDDSLQTIVMIWTLPWNRMTLGQADYLVVCGHLIQNAVVHANRYLSSLQEERYVKGMELLNTEAFLSLAHSFLQAKEKGLTECTLLEVDAGEKNLEEVCPELRGSLRGSDYIGEQGEGKVYVLLANTSERDAQTVIKRFQGKNYKCRMKEEREL